MSIFFGGGGSPESPVSVALGFSCGGLSVAGTEREAILLKIKLTDTDATHNNYKGAS